MPFDQTKRIDAIIIARSIDKSFLMEKLQKTRGQHATHRFPGLYNALKSDVDKRLENFEDIHYIQLSDVPRPTYVFVATAKYMDPIDDNLHITCEWMSQKTFYDLWKYSHGATLANYDVVALCLLTLHMRKERKCSSMNRWIQEGCSFFVDV